MTKQATPYWPGSSLTHPQWIFQIPTEFPFSIQDYLTSSGCHGTGAMLYTALGLDSWRHWNHSNKFFILSFYVMTQVFEPHLCSVRNLNLKDCFTLRTWNTELVYLGVLWYIRYIWYIIYTMYIWSIKCISFIRYIRYIRFIG